MISDEECYGSEQGKGTGGVRAAEPLCSDICASIYPSTHPSILGSSPLNARCIVWRTTEWRNADSAWKLRAAQMSKVPQEKLNRCLGIPKEGRKEGLCLGEGSEKLCREDGI